MAVIKAKNKEIKVKEGDSIMSACEGLGVPFSCRVGICGICKIDVESGVENLSEKTDEEKVLVKGNQRLACQCKIKKGEVKIKF